MPRQEYLTDARSAVDPPFRRRGDPPFRLDDIAVFIVGDTRYAIPVGHMWGQYGGDVTFEAAVRGGGHETPGLYGLNYWMPSGRYKERQSGSYQRYCEPGRLPPGPDEYVVTATVLAPDSEQGSEWRAERLQWSARTEAALGFSIADVLAGRVSEHVDRVVADVPGAIVYDGLSWRSDLIPRGQSSDPLRYRSLRAQSDDLFAVIRCIRPTTAAVNGARTRAPWESCEVRHVGPIDASSPLPEMRFNIPRRNLGDWAEIYWSTIDLIENWRISDGRSRNRNQ